MAKCHFICQSVNFALIETHLKMKYNRKEDGNKEKGIKQFKSFLAQFLSSCLSLSKNVARANVKRMVGACKMALETYL